MLQCSEQAASLRVGSDNNQASLSQRQMPVWKVTTEWIRLSLCSSASGKGYWRTYWCLLATANDKISYFLHYFMWILFLQRKRILFMNTYSLIIRRHWLLLPQFLTSTSHLSCLQSYTLHSQLVALYIYISVYLYICIHPYIHTYICICISVFLHLLQWSSLYRKQFLSWPLEFLRHNIREINEK